MNPALIMAMIQAGIGGAQMIAGHNQAQNNTRPTFEVPSEIKTMLELTKRRANESMIPGQGYYENKIDRNSASALQGSRSAATNPAQLLEAATGINNNANNSFENLALMGVQNKERNMADYTRALNIMAGYKDKAFEYNDARKYQENAGAASSLVGAGMQNLYGGIDNTGSYFEMKNQQDSTADLLKQLQSGSGGETMTESLNGPAGQYNIQDTGFDINQLQDLIKSWGQNGFGDTGINIENFG